MTGPFGKTKGAHDVVTLLASGARTSTSTGTAAVRLPVPLNAVAIVLDVSAGADDIDDTLNVFIQTKLDGTNWVDVVHFTEVLGNAAVKRFVAKLAAPIAMTMFNNATALGAAAVRDLLGDEWRVRWVIVDPTGSDASFTFSVTAIPM